METAPTIPTSNPTNTTPANANNAVENQTPQNSPTATTSGVTATTQALLTPTTETEPAVAVVSANELSGVIWVNRFLGSAEISELEQAFQQQVTSFFAAISAAGGNTRVSATYRPPERAYLMHYCSKLSRGEIEAEDIPARDGVNINWVHPTKAQSKAAATAMANSYGIVYPPALTSNHTQRTAIDVTITNIVGKNIRDAGGNNVRINALSDLNAVGATFGVLKLVSDPPHWSNDGH